MADKTGAARLRQAIRNQRDLGNGDFRLTYHDAEEIADEIEEELFGICSSAEREIGRYAWAHGVPAPVDADGEVVPLGTEKLYTDYGEMVRVDSICYGARLWHVKRMHSDKTYWLDSLHLHLHDSWEKLEKDVSRTGDKDICGYFGFALNKPCSAECPASDVNESCAVVAMRDVARRAKALAERDVKASTPQSSPHVAKEANHD